MSPFRVHDPALPGLERALTPAALGHAHATLTKVRHKPGERCVLLYESSRGERCRPLFYVKVVPPARSRAAATKLAHRPDRAAAAIRSSAEFAGEGVFLYGFPNDARLRRLPHLVDPKRLKRDVMRSCPALLESRFRVSGKSSRIELVRYKPERRAVALLDLALVDDRTGEKRRATLFGKQIAGRSTQAIVERLEVVRAHAAGFRVPEVCGASDATGTVFVRAAEGRSLREILSTDDVEPAWHAAGRALRAFHSSRLVFAAQLDAPAMRRLVSTAAGALGHALPDERPRIARLADAVSRRRERSAPPVPVHGDFHDRQVFIEGDTATFVDLDEAAMGDAGDDVASALAHLEALRVRRSFNGSGLDTAARAFIAGYGAMPSGVQLAAALLRLAEFGFREASPTAPEIALEMIARAEATLDGSGLGA